MVTQAHPYIATDEDIPFGPDVPLFTGVPAPQPAVLPLDLAPQQFTKEACTLKNQSERWLWWLQHRKSKDLAPSSLVAFKSRLRKILEFIPEQTLLADITNDTFRSLAAQASEPLSAKSVHELLVTLKLILSSAVDCHGNRMFPLILNSDFIDAPKIRDQHRPSLTAGDVETLIALAKTEQERLLYIVLASTGLRIAELQAIHIGPQDETHTTWDYGTASIYVRSSCFLDREIPRLKTAAARRTIHLHSNANEVVAEFAKQRKSGSYLFQDSEEQAVRASKVRRSMAQRLFLAAPHGFRRFRTTFLRQARLQEDILKLEIGHSSAGDITSVYSRPSDEACRAAIEAAGIGFNIGGKNA